MKTFEILYRKDCAWTRWQSNVPSDRVDAEVAACSRATLSPWIEAVPPKTASRMLRDASVRP